MSQDKVKDCAGCQCKHCEAGRIKAFMIDVLAKASCKQLTKVESKIEALKKVYEKWTAKDIDGIGLDYYISVNDYLDMAQEYHQAIKAVCEEKDEVKN